MVATLVSLEVAVIAPLPLRPTVNLVLLVVMFSVSDAGLTVMALSPLAMPQETTLASTVPSDH